MIMVEEAVSKKVSLKELHLCNGEIIDKDGEIKDLAKILAKVFADVEFDLVMTAKSTDKVPVDETID